MITLYEYGPTRAVRVRWTLQELGLEFESVAKRELIGSDELRKFHPQAKLPALVDDGKPLFESAAICTYLADREPSKGLIAKPGTMERALHDQWTSFALTELEAWLWSSAKHSMFYPEEQRVPEVLETNRSEALAGTSVLESALQDSDYLVGNRFSVTDIIVAYTVNWANRMGLLEERPKLAAYLERLRARPHCALPPAM